jgi:hypothetical protein
MAGKYGHRNCDWNLDADGFDWNRANLGMMMDIRTELRQLNTLLHCSNFTDIPNILRGVRKNTARPKRKKAQANRSSVK